VRIEGNLRIGNSSGRGASRNGSSGTAFHVDEGSAAPRAAATAAMAPSTGIDALLALQAVEDPLLKRRKLVRRGSALLDTLQEIAADLLVGRASEGRLNQLLALIGQARERGEPELDALLDDIELRARVELAKRGLFPQP
jgi:succinate dehydrogenase/fumarate reductase flavoprotein subunit